MRSQVQCFRRRQGYGGTRNVQGYFSVGLTESAFTTARPATGTVQGCLFHAFACFPLLVGFNVVFIREPLNLEPLNPSVTHFLGGLSGSPMTGKPPF